MMSNYANFTDEEIKLFEYIDDIKRNREPYILTPEEKQKVISILCGCEGLGLDIMEIYKHRSGKIIVRTPARYWVALMGREWVVDLEEGTGTLFSLS